MLATVLLVLCLATIALAQSCAVPIDLSLVNGAQITNRKTAITATLPDIAGCNTYTYAFTAGPRAGESYTGVIGPGFTFFDNQLYQTGDAAPYLETGNYELRFTVSASDGSKTGASTTIAFTVVDAGPCPAIVFTLPPNDSSFNAPFQPTLVGKVDTARPDCSNVRFVVTGGSNSLDDTRGLSLDGEVDYPLPNSPASYVVEATVFVEVGVDESSPTEFRYTIGAILCQPPTVTAPAEGSYVRTLRPTFTGTQPDPSTCPFVSLNLGSNYPTLGPVAVQPDGTFTYTPDFDLSQGSILVNAQAVTSSGQATSEFGVGNTFSVLARCFQPNLYLATVTGSSVHIEASDISVSDAGCRVMTFIANGQVLGTGQIVGDIGFVTTFSLDKANLAPGDYVLTAVLGQGDLASDASAPLTFTIGSVPSVSAHWTMLMPDQTHPQEA
jgi:hypothetical protein